MTPTDGYAAMVARLKLKPDAHRRIRPGDVYDPEMVMALDFDAPEAICLAERTDGYGDFIRFDRTALPHAARWISRTVDQQCLGLALPGTSEPDGLSCIRQNGQTMIIAPGAAFECAYQIGSVDPAGAEQLKADLSHRN